MKSCFWQQIFQNTMFSIDKLLWWQKAFNSEALNPFLGFILSCNFFFALLNKLKSKLTMRQIRRCKFKPWINNQMFYMLFRMRRIQFCFDVTKLFRSSPNINNLANISAINMKQIKISFSLWQRRRWHRLFKL